MSTPPRSARRLSLLVVLAVGLTTLVAAPPAAAVPGSTYSGPLHTAVRQLPVAAEDNAGYDRVKGFGGWADADGDCLSTRHEVLVAESRVAPTLSSSGCTVTAGQWRSFYDGLPYTLARELQIDHLVPLAEAWGSGARSWTRAQRVAFANDLGVGYALNAMPGSLNASKSARGPEAWMPPVDRCRYIEIWTAMKHRWRLSVDPAERDALVSYADACPNRAITVATALDAPAAPRTIAGPARTARGATATVAGTAAAGAQVHLWTRKQGQPSFTLLRRLTADDAGRWAVPYRARVDQVFYAVAGGGRTRTVTVRAVGTTLTSPPVVRRGARVVLRGLARPGGRVDVLFRAGGTSVFVDRRDLVAAADGAWSTSYVADRDYAVQAATAEGRSPARIVRVA